MWQISKYTEKLQSGVRAFIDTRERVHLSPEPCTPSWDTWPFPSLNVSTQTPFLHTLQYSGTVTDRFVVSLWEIQVTSFPALSKHFFSNFITRTFFCPDIAGLVVCATWKFVLKSGNRTTWKLVLKSTWCDDNTFCCLTPVLLVFLHVISPSFLVSTRHSPKSKCPNLQSDRVL